MKLGRFKLRNSDKIFYGQIDGSTVIELDNLLNRHSIAEHSLEMLSVLSPIVPTKIIGVGLNYRRHAEELKMPLPNSPVLFMKPVTALIGSGDFIVYPSMSVQVDYEAELAVVIGKRAKDVPIDKVNEVILGYTPFNDVTARDLQRIDGQWTRAKGFDTFAPVGPFIETECDPSNLKIQAILNGNVMQDSNTSDMIFTVPQLVSFISSIMTLMPGDIIATGTPEGIGSMRPGDEIIIRIQGMDDLINKVAK